MTKQKLLLSVLGLAMFIPVDIMAYQSGVKPSSLKSLTYKECNGNFLKFKMINNKLHINDEYTHPLQKEIQDLYYKALESTPTTLTLAHELSRMSKKDESVLTQNPDTLYRYLHRYTFAHVGKAQEVRYLLKKFIKQNNLFEMFT